MTVAELKLEAIKKLINTEDEGVLQKILVFLEDIAPNNETADLHKNYDAIKEQYGEDLQKLSLLPQVESIVTDREEVLKKLAK